MLKKCSIAILLILVSGFLPGATRQVSGNTAADTRQRNSTIARAEALTAGLLADEQTPPPALYLPLILGENGEQVHETQTELATQRPVTESQKPLLDRPLPEWQPPLTPSGDELILVAYDTQTGVERTIQFTGTVQESTFLTSAGSSAGLDPPSGQAATLHAPDATNALGNFTRVNYSPDTFPWSAIVKLTVTFNGNAYHCNGALIDPKFVITSGDCVHDQSLGGWAQSIVAYPAYANGPSIWGAANSTHLYSLIAWTQDRNLRRNWGLVQLDRPVGALAIWLGYGYDSNDAFYARNVNNPVYLDQKYLYNRSGQFDTIEIDAFIHNGPSVSNHNGGVIFLQMDNGQQWVHGVSSFTRNNNTQTGFARMIKSVFDIFHQNVSTNTPSQPDLIPLNVQTTPTVNAGEQIGAMTYRLHNYSSATYNGIVTVKYYLSTNDIISTGDQLLALRTVQATIDPKRRFDVTVSSPPQIPLETPSGVYWIGVIVDIADADTSNNATTSWDTSRIVVTGAQPHLRVAPARLDFATTEGGSAPASQRISINNSGFGSFNWSATANQSWIVLKPGSGVNGGVLNVSINMAALPANQLIHNGEITINAPATVEGSAKIPISLQLTPPGLRVTPGEVDFQAVLGQPVPPAQTVNLMVDGAQSLTWNAASTSAWLQVTPASGAGNSVLSVSIDPSALKVGSYLGQIIVTASNAAEAKLLVSLNVIPGVPELQLSPATLEITAIEGSNPGAKALTIVSTVDYPFNWVATTDAPWVINRRGAGHTPDLFTLSLDTVALTPGEYTSNVVVTSPDKTGKEWVAPIKLTVKPRSSGVPNLQVGPPALSFAAIATGANPTPQLLLIENLGEGELRWQASADVNWLALSPTSGVNRGQLNVAAAISQLPAGVHRGQITINGGAGGTQVVSVLLLLDQPSTLAIDGTNLVFSGLTGQPDPPAERFTIRNAGDGNFTWQTAEDMPWLTLEQSSGSAPATIQATASSKGLGVGVYSGNIAVRSDAALNSQQAVDAKFLLRRGPALGTYPHTLRFDVVSGESNPPPVEIEIQNVGRGDLNWRAASNVSWLTLAEPQGVIGTAGRKALRVVVQSAALEPRDAPYNAQLTVQTDNGEGGPQTIDVALTVMSKARYCRIPNGGGDWVLNTSYIKLRLENVQRTFTDDGGCDLQAQLRANLPQNANLTANVNGHVDATNNFIPIASSPLILKIAYFELQLADKFSISDQYGIQANGGTWKMPVDFGSSNQQFNGQIQIGPKGLSISGQSDFTMPDLKWGATTMYNLKGRVRFSTDGAYVLDLSGDMRVGVKKSPDAVAKGLQLTVDQRGIRSGRIGYFAVNNFAGMTLKVSEAIIENNQLRAQRTYLAVPSLWGGAEVSLYGLAIHKNGDVSVTGGKFKLPEIAAGGDAVKLTSLEGSLIALPGGGYEIFAQGVFGLKGIESVGNCSLKVAVTVQTGVNGSSALTVASLDTQQPLLTQQTPQPVTTLHAPEGVNGLFLKEATVGLLDCAPGVAIGPTGFFITGVQGTVRLENPTRVEKVELTVWIESGAKLGTLPVIRAVPVTTIYPDPFRITFKAPVYFLRMKTQETAVEITRRVFKTEVTYNYTVFHARLAVEAGINGASKFYVQGDGSATVGVEQGALGEICDETGVSGVIFGESCVSLPDRDYNLAAAEAHINLDGVTGKVKIVGGYRASFHFSFHDGSLSFALSRLLQLVSSAQIAQARQNWQAYQRGEVVAAALDQRFHFADNGSVRVAMSVEPAVPTVSASALITNQPYTINVQSDVIFALVQPPTGTLTFSLIDPQQRRYTPENLPTGVNFEETHSITETQSTFSVQQAMPGTWLAVVDGETVGTPFFLSQFANTPPPVWADITAQEQSNTAATVSWRLLAAEPNTRINIYATNRAITETMLISDLQGVATPQQVYFFAGTLVAENLASATDGTLQTQTLDLSTLESGDYALWLKAIGPQGGTTRCYILIGQPGCTQPTATNAPPARVRVRHTLPETWSPAVTVALDSKRGQLRLTWPENPHPDLNTYALRISHTDPLSPTHVIAAEIAVGAANNGMVNTLVDNIEPGQTYTLAVGVGNQPGGNMLWSAAQTFTAPQPDFILAPQVNGVSAAQVDGLTVQAGGSALVVPLGVDLSSNLPYPVELYCDFARLADGFYVEFDNTAVAASVTAGVATARISASATTPPGHYAVPIVARSGELIHDLHLNIEVVSAVNGVYLPVVMKR